MKNIIQKIEKNDTKLTALFAVAILMFIGLACHFNVGTESNTTSEKNTVSEKSDTVKKDTDDDKADVPSDSELQSLVKASTSDFADAVEEEDFSDFLKTTSGDFQAQYTGEQLKDAFSTFIQKKNVIVPLLKKTSNTKANFSSQPRIRMENNIPVLDTSGTFQTEPYPVNFDISYELEGSDWKLLKIKYKM